MARKFVLLISPLVGKADEIREILNENDIPTILSTSYEEGLDMMLTFHPSLVILTCGTDVMEQKQLHELSGKLLQKLVPLIVVTSRLDRLSLKQLHRQGIFDNVELPLDFTSFNRLVMNRMTFKEQVDKELIYDEIPGVFKRKLFYEHVEQKKIVAGEKYQSFTAALININQLKALNSQIGIAEVDKVIAQFVQLLKQSAQHPSIYRFSGKEFLVLFDGISMDTAKQQLLQIAEQFKAFGQTLCLSNELSFSSGLASWDSPDKTVNSLLEELDTNLHASKRNTVDNADYETSPPIKTGPPVTGRPNLEIILLDDDPIILEILTNQLDGLSEESFHITVKSFSNGHDFVHSDWYDSSTYYVLIVDGVMPKMSGFEVLQQVRASYPSEKIIITMLTSRDSGADIDFSLQAGADDYITKPFRPKEVSLRIQRLIRRLFQ